MISILTALVMVGSSSIIPLVSMPVDKDLFPLATGNYWEFQSRTGGTVKMSVIGHSGDSTSIETRTDIQGYKNTDTSKVVSYDALGHFHQPCYRDLECAIWGPHVGKTTAKPITTPAGTFNQILDYPITWGHPSGGNRNFILAPGVGPIVKLLVSMVGPSIDTFQVLKSYNVQRVPQGTVKYQYVTQEPLTHCTFQYFGGDSGRIFFVMNNTCTMNAITVSYNEPKKTIRVYVTDDLLCSNTGRSMHEVGLRYLTPGETYRLKIYKAYYDPAINLITDRKYPLTTTLLHDKGIAAQNPVSVQHLKAPRSRFHSHNEYYTISGKRVQQNSARLKRTTRLLLQRNTTTAHVEIVPMGQPR